MNNLEPSEKEMIRELINKLSKLDKMESDQLVEDRTKPILGAFHSLVKRMDSVVTDERILSGIEEFDQYNGFYPGEFVIFGSRPAMGKSALLQTLVMNMSKDHPVLYFSLEASEGALMQRLVSQLTEIPFYKIMRNDLNALEKQLVKGIDKEFSGRKFYINDDNINSLTALREICKKYVDECGVELICIDYIQLIRTDRYRHNREQEMSYVSRELKKIAKDLNVVVIATSQLSRSVEMRGGDKRPILSDLRESGSIEQEADKVFFVYRPEYYGLMQDENGNNTQGIMELILAKNKSGTQDSYKLTFLPGINKISSFADHFDRFYVHPERKKETDGEPF